VEVGLVDPHLAEDLEGPLLGLAGVQDDRQVVLHRDLAQAPQHALLLGGLICDPVLVEAALADGDEAIGDAVDEVDLGVHVEGRRRLEGVLPGLPVDAAGDGVDRVDAEGGQEVLVALAQGEHLAVRPRLEPVDDDVVEPGVRGALGDRVLLAGEARVDQVGVDVDVHGPAG